MVRGGFACVAMIGGFGLVAFRDPWGIRPLIYGRRSSGRSSNSPSEHTTDYMMASESVALDAMHYDILADVQPGEVVVINQNRITSRICSEFSTLTPCIFEYVYFARPDSFIDGISVYRARLQMGEMLAKKVSRMIPLSEIDVIIPVPETSRGAALQLSFKLNILYREGLIKNRYVGRTFIMPDQFMRSANVKRKLNLIKQEFAGKRVLLVDDSIVRGTTSRELIQMARDAGAVKVYLASCAPPVRHPNVYGIDMPTRRELFAYNKTEAEIASGLGADAVVYQELDDLVAACTMAAPNGIPNQFDTSVFTGSYVTGDVTEAYLAHLDATRRRSPSCDNEQVGLFNMKNGVR